MRHVMQDGADTQRVISLLVAKEQEINIERLLDFITVKRLQNYPIVDNTIIKETRIKVANDKQEPINMFVIPPTENISHHLQNIESVIIQ